MSEKDNSSRGDSMTPGTDLGIVRGLQEKTEAVLAANVDRISNASVRRIQGKPPRIIVSKTHAITVDLRTGRRTVSTATTANPFGSAPKITRPMRHVSFREIRVSALLEAACRAWEVDIGTMLSSNRSQRAALPRFAAYRLMRDTFGWSTTIIGRHLGNRDHTTVMHGLCRVEWLLEHDPEWTRRYAIAAAEVKSAGEP